jgi:protein-S-isoprenylcysteine O-methyltransferase Ste14
MGVVFVMATLFIPAGRLDWVMGWALVGIYLGWITAAGLIIAPRNPDLLIERASRRQGMKTWDVALLSMIGLLTIVKHVVAGLDLRFGWTAVPFELQIAGLVIAAQGYALTTWAMVANAFFSTVTRIQADRGHHVVTSGPYRFVRHPGYTGTIAFELTTPLMLGSLWALIPGGLAVLLTVVRTALEDRTLRQELPGYTDYARQTKYRLLPGIW